MHFVSVRALVCSGLFAFLLLAGNIGALAAQESTPVAISSGTPSATSVFDAIVEIDGRGVHVACVGTGSPTILVEPGGPSLLGGTAEVDTVGPDVSAILGVRFCSYDRAGTGLSDVDPVGVRTVRESAADLQAVLKIPDLGCPCVVAGASLGGAISLVALSDDPAGFAGLLLLDSPYPGFWDEFLALAPAGSPEEVMDSDAYYSGENEEHLDMTAGFRQVTVPDAPPAIPVVVVSHGAGDPPGCWPCSDAYPVAEFEVAWQAGQLALAEALGGKFVVAENTGHFIAEENPALVIELAAEIIAAVLHSPNPATPVATPAA